MPRRVQPVSGFETEFLDQFGELPPGCAASSAFLYEELKRRDPDRSEVRPGAPGGYELFSMPMADCPEWRFVVTIRREGTTIDVFTHGFVADDKTADGAAADLAYRQLDPQTGQGGRT